MNIPLRCCGGAAPPPAVVDGWRSYLQVPPAGQIDVWKLAVDALAQGHESLSEDRIQALCSIHDLPPEQVVQGVLACQFLLAGACSSELDAPTFRADLVALSEDSPSDHEVIISRYEAVKAELLNLDLVRMMAEHGKVLEDVDWRLDKIVSSSRGYHREADVIFLTLKYQEAGTSNRITLQVSPRGVAALQKFLSRFQS